MLRCIPTILVIAIGIVLSAFAQQPANERSLSTAVASMEQLLETERLAIHTLEQYATELEQNLQVIRSGVHMMRVANLRASADAEQFLTNPINAFNLIRRTHEDWLHWLLFLEKPIGSDKIKTLEKLRIDMPTVNDLNDAVTAILRLTTTYDIKPDDMAKGILRGVQYDAKMSSLDAYRVGFDVATKDDGYDAVFWLYSALNAFEPNAMHTVYDFTRDGILRVYAEALAKQNRFKDALNVITDLQTRAPNSLELMKRMQELRRQSIVEHGPILYSPPVPMDTYILGCRGGYAHRTTKLHCRYNTTTTPFLKLAPLKLEEVSLEPYIVVYHDVLYDSEIEELKQMARPNLRRATVYAVDKGQGAVISSRTSQFAWFHDKHNAVTERVNRRLVDMTGFNLNGSEMLQVMNYGLGGHYDTHYDFFNVSDTADVVRTNGDRKSTVLFYLTDVEEGGATVFSNIGISVVPKKGTAVMWYNLDNAGNVDARTLHAACPVLIGSKWVCNKWIRQKNQVFRCPCYK